MPSTQKLSETIETMVQVLETMKNDELSLDEMMEAFSRAIESYKQYQACISNECLDVLEIKVEMDQLVECKYEWR
jgi:exonuclease VII small subunit